MRTTFLRRTLLSLLPLLGILILLPGTSFAGPDGFEGELEIDNEREGLEGDMDRDRTHFEELRHDELRPDWEDDDRNIDIEREEIEGDMDRDEIHYDEIDGDRNKDWEDFNDRNTEEGVRDRIDTIDSDEDEEDPSH